MLHIFFWFLEDRQLCEDYGFTTTVETSDEEETNRRQKRRGKENDDPLGKSLEIVVGQVYFCLQGLNQKEMSMEMATIDMLHTHHYILIYTK